jgi:hypothetical protein
MRPSGLWRQAGLFTTTDLTRFNGDFSALREVVKAQLFTSTTNVGQHYSNFASPENFRGTTTCAPVNNGVKGFVKT